MKRRENFTVDGSIVRITMENFMTYRHETFWPGPSFNVTVGPNGSGKSSIVTALSIALGGSLASLNRQTDLTSLINANGESKDAKVEVELFIKEGKNVVVTCILDAQGSPPIWKINGKDCGKKALAEMMEELQIQPGNLCQFLPQDVVRDFPSMTNQKIFYNTVKAIGDSELLETYNTLKVMEGDIKDLEEKKETEEKRLEHLLRREERLSVDKQSLEKKKTIEKKKLTIENAILWQEFSILREKCKATKTKKQEYEKQIKEKEDEKAPIAKFLELYETKVLKLKTDMEVVDKTYQENSRNVEHFDITSLEDKLERLMESEKDLDQRETNRVESKRNIMREIERISNLIENTSIDPDIDQKIQDTMAQKIRKEEQLHKSEGLKNETEFQKARYRTEVEKLIDRKEQLQNKSNQKLKILLRENKDAHEGVLWLRKHKHLFQKPVHEPIMLCLDVKSPDHARILETQIGKLDLEGFVCESTEDVNLLTKSLREDLGLKRISAFHSNPDDMSKFPHPFSRGQLEKYEFDQYLSDMYEAPVAVKAYLCRQKQLHRIPYFKQENRCSDDLKEKFNNYFIGTIKYNCRKSKYSGELSTGCEDIGTRRIFRLAVAEDRVELERVQSDLDEKKKELVSKESLNVRLLDILKKLRQTIDDKQTELDQLRLTKNILPKLRSELAVKERTLATVEQPELDVKEVKKRIYQKKKTCISEICENMNHLRSLVRVSVNKAKERKLLHLKYQNVEVENSENLGKREELQIKIDRLMEEQSEHLTAFNKLRQELSDRHTKAMKATNGTNEKFRFKPPEVWTARFKLLEATDINVLGALLDDCESELKLIKPISEKTIADINAIEGKVDKARDEKQKLDEDILEKNQEANRLKRAWMSGVEGLIEKIDDRFGTMMANLGYAGEIQLSRGKRDIDFSSYGISIKVRFRAGQEMQELSRGVQSGGEKSVTTAVYMMALQELTQVPFRCVDEINQGMDERNERLVWDQLLAVCRKYKAQYFYMAPKFPYSLPFDDQVNIVVCNNGAVGKRSHREYRMKSFVELAKRRKLSDD